MLGLTLTMLMKGPLNNSCLHYGAVIMRTMASQITSISTVCSVVFSGAHQRKHQGSASLTFVKGIHQWSVDSPHKGPVPRKMFPSDDFFMYTVQRPDDSGQHRPMPWLLMTWRRKEPRHQQPWFWLCKIYGSPYLQNHQQPWEDIVLHYEGLFKLPVLFKWRGIMQNIII